MIVYDNEGKTFDRYSVLTNLASGLFGQPGLWECLGLSHNPDSPQGFSQWGLALPGSHLGKIISFHELPENVQIHATRRIAK